MKTTEKDILMLCKEHYDHDKYKTLEEAMLAYYNKHYRYEENKADAISYKFIVTLWINACIKTFLNPETQNSYLLYVVNQESIHERNLRDSKDAVDYYEAFFYRAVTWLCLLDVRDKDKNWIIDLSDYFNADNECENII